MGKSPDDFSVLVIASDLGIDARSLLNPSAKETMPEESQVNCHDCLSLLPADDFFDLELSSFASVHGSDRGGNRILRIVGKLFPAHFVNMERVKKYILHKIVSEFHDEPFCIVYMHSCVHTEDNSPGLSALRWIYEQFSPLLKDKLQVVYFIHPGLRARLLFATLGRFFLSGGLYWKIKYVSRLQYLWEDIEKREIEIPEMVKKHDDVLEHRPLTDYGIEPDTLQLTLIPSYSFGHEERWMSREYMS